MRSFFPILILFFGWWGTCICKAETSALNPDTERIMELGLDDGTTLNSALIVYQTPGDWYLPLGQVSDALGFAIHFSSALSSADGFILDETRKFHLTLGDCTVLHDGVMSQYPCGEVSTYNDDIYVKRSRMEQWFPISILVNPLQSKISIHAKEKLPEQLRREREELALRSKGFMDERGEKYPTLSTSYEFFEFPFIDEQLSYAAQMNASSPTEHVFTHTTQVGGEFAGLESYLLLSGSEKKFDRWRLSFSRTSPDANLMGPFHLRQAQFFDVDLPQLPLISNTRTARGFLLSSYPINAPVNFNRYDFQGTLPPGWEVVLYRNDVLIDRQLGNSGSRYLFRNVNLIYGKNTFKLSFFGPHGERRDEYKTFNVDPKLLGNSERDYRLGLAFQDSGKETMLLQGSQNLGQFVSANLGAYYNQDNFQKYFFAGINGVNELFFFSATCAFSSLGGKACEWGQQIGIGEATLGGKYTRLFNYSSELFNTSSGVLQDSQIEANLYYVLPFRPGLALDTRATKKNYEDGSSQTSLTQWMTLASGGFLFSNRLEYQFNISNPLLGMIEASYIPGNTRFRTGVEYDTERFKSVEEEITHSVQKNYNINFLARYQMVNRIQSMALTYSKIFKSFTLGIRGSESDFRDYSLGLIGSFSIVQDVQGTGLSAFSDATTSYGAASVLTYLDKNHNHRRDAGEKSIPGVKLVLNQREDVYTTDSDGMVFIPYLRPHQPSSIAISEQAIEDPFIRPIEKGYQFVPRPSKTTRVDLALEVVGEIDGYTYWNLGKNSTPKRGLKLELLDSSERVISTTQSDQNGFYSFDGVIPGKYTVRIATQSLLTSSLRATPVSHSVTVAETGSFESNRDFSLSRTP